MPDETWPKPHEVDFTFGTEPWACEFKVDGRPLMVTGWKVEGPEDVLKGFVTAELHLDLGRAKWHVRGHFVVDEGTLDGWPGITHLPTKEEMGDA